MDTIEHRSGIYLRISDDKEGLELGVARQEEDCLGLSDLLHRVVYKIYKDNDISASTRSRKIRPGYQQLLQDARAGLIDTIIAYTSSRLTRRPRENEDLITLAEEYGIEFRYVASPSFDLNTAAGRLVARTLAAVDANQAEATAELIARKKLEKATRGQYMGGARAYGFEGPVKDEQTGVLLNKGRINIAVIEKEKAVWLEGVDRVLAGEREIDLILDFNARGHLSSTGTPWQTGNLKHVLLNRRFVAFDASNHPADCPCLGNPEGNGTLTHKGIEHRAVWPAFISQSVHAQLIAAFELNGQPWAHGLLAGRKYLLSGLAVCGNCGTPLYGQRRNLDKGGKQRRYRCRGKDNHGQPWGCGKVFRDQEAVDDFVVKAVFAQFDSPEAARILAPKEDQARATELGQQLAGHKARRNQLVVEYGRGEHKKADYKIMLAAADEAIEKAQSELSKLHAAKVAGTLPALGPLQEVWDASSIEWQRSVIRLVVERVIVKPRTPGARLKDGKLFNPNDIEIQWVEGPVQDALRGLQVLVVSARRYQVAVIR